MGSRLSRWVVVPAIAGVLASGGCEGIGTASEFDAFGSLASALCELRDRCGCEDPDDGFPGGQTCTERLIDELAPPDYEREASGLLYDKECSDAIALRLRSQRCDEPPTLREPNDCTAVYGRATLGEPCQVGTLVDTCQRGLTCVGGLCTDRPDISGPVSEGSPCPVDGCPEALGLFCSAAGVCELLPREMEPCDPFVGCAPGLACTNDGLCQEGRELGESCTGHAQCISGYCPRGACEARPGEGEACGTQGLCALGLSCQAGVCVGAALALCAL